MFSVFWYVFGISVLRLWFGVVSFGYGVWILIGCSGCGLWQEMAWVREAMGASLKEIQWESWQFCLRLRRQVELAEAVRQSEKCWGGSRSS